MARQSRVSRGELYLLALTTVLFLFVIGTTFYHYSEGISWFNALYLTTATLLTIGYGDIAPHKELSRIFTIFYVIISIPTILFLLGWIVEDFFKQRIQKIDDEISDVIKKEDTILAEEALIIKEETEKFERLSNKK